jgi:putative inorganic carbon (hco3(-)) transporter
LTASATDEPLVRRPRRRRRSSTTTATVARGPWAVTLVMAAVALALPFMLGNRTPDAMAASMLLLVSGAFLAGLLAMWPGNSALPAPDRGWVYFAAVFTALVLLQVVPIPALAAAFGPYPEALWSHPEFAPRHWSPDIGATLRGWAVFMALFTIAWIAYSLPASQRNVLWLLLVVGVLFQAAYGVAAHASGSETIFGIWERNTPHAVHGSFSNYNLFAAYLALLWPLAVAVWWIRDMPLLGLRSKEVKIAGSLITSAVIGAALLGSTSRLGSSAGLAGMTIALVLWSRHRHVLRKTSVWPAYLALGGGLLAAAWYGLAPLVERLMATGMHDMRFEVLGLIRSELPLSWYLHGVGLGGFEAAFKQIQPGHMTFWLDYAHSDLLQWVIETGIVGVVLLIAVIIAVIRAARPSTERIALYAGLAALALVGLGDFSWHIPATQAVLALYLGTLLRPPVSTGRH